MRSRSGRRGDGPSYGRGLTASRGALAAMMGLGLAPGTAASQAATVLTEENFRSAPNGAILATVRPGVELEVVGEEGGWLQVELGGWVWATSLQATERNGFDLVVSSDGGENLRAEPQGAPLARLSEGTLLEELERRPGWIRTRRVGFMWARSLDRSAGGATPTRDAPPGTEASPPSLAVLMTPPSGLTVLSGPDGDTLARARPGTDLQVLGREGNWVRVRLDGWSWVAPDLPESDSTAVLANVTPSDVREDPLGHIGRVVRWTLQFISLERAENVRTDFYEGEPFLLTRVTEGDRYFVYVAVPPERIADVEGLTPLERLLVVGRIRQGASALTGSPILELVELVRSPG